MYSSIGVTADCFTRNFPTAFESPYALQQSYAVVQDEDNSPTPPHPHHKEPQRTDDDIIFCIERICMRMQLWAL